MSSFNATKRDVFDRVNRLSHYRSNFMGISAFERHKKLVEDYMNYYSDNKDDRKACLNAAQQVKNIRTDRDALIEHHRFIRTEEDEKEEESWEKRLAKQYYERLFKEYCIADLTRYKESKIGLRWRIQREVVSGKGQFICGNKHCDAKENLCSYEVNFAYDEAGQRKHALVKLRVCPQCAYKLNYRKEREFKKAQSRKRRFQEQDLSARIPEKDFSKRLKQLIPGISDNDIRDAYDSVVRPPSSSTSRRDNEEEGNHGNEDGCGKVERREGEEYLGKDEGDGITDSNKGSNNGSNNDLRSTLPADMSVWEKKQVVENTAEEEFEQYFEDMFL